MKIFSVMFFFFFFLNYQILTGHAHPHFNEFADFYIGSTLGRKGGFCIQTTNRDINSRYSPMATQYSTCEYQGITPGWSDNYNIGLPCQWIDVTDWTPKNSTLGTNVNPLGWLCEGSINTDSSGEELWIPSGRKTDSQWPPEHRNKPIDIKKCTNSYGAYKNNKLSVPVSIPNSGEGYLTSTCIEPGQTVGPKRDCEFTQRSSYDGCTPGVMLQFTCSVDSNAKPQVFEGL